MPFLRIQYSDLVFDERAQIYCKNAKLTCPNYAQSWACPPVAPFLKDFLSQFSNFILIYFKYELNTLSDKMRINHPDWSEKMCRNSRYYNNTIRKGLKTEIELFLKTYPERNSKYFILWSGTCRVCKNRRDGGCTYPSGTPCRYPYKRQYSMEAVGIDVDTTVKKFGINLEWPPFNWVYQIGLLCIK